MRGTRGDVTWGVSTSMCSWYSHSRFPMQRGRLEYRIAGQTCGVWWALAAQHQSGRALSYLRQGAKFNDVRCPHRVVLDVSTPALDMKGFRLSQRREAPPPTRAFVLAAAAMRMRERHPAGRDICCSRGSCCRLGQEQSAMRGEGSALRAPRPHIGIVGRGWNKRPQGQAGRDENRGGRYTPML